MYDLVIKGGQVLDPAAGVKGALDVAVQNGKVAKIAPGIDPKEARRIIFARDKLVMPGLIDLHVHAYDGGTQESISPDLAGVHSGVCTVVDAGSAGSHTFGSLVRHVAPRAATRMFSFVHIARTGLAAYPEIRSREDIDLAATVRVIESHRPFVQGVKLRLAGHAFAEIGLEVVKLAKQAARETGTRVMVHIGDRDGLAPPELTRQTLRILEKGDIITHCYTGNRGSLLDERGVMWAEVKEAVARGVVMDAAQGRYNFGFEAARRLLDQGLIAHTISSDMTLPGRTTRVFSLTEIMSKFLALGFSLEDVVRMTTAGPAAALGMADRLGSLAEGGEADLTVLDVVDGEFAFRDSAGGSMRGRTALVPVMAIRAGQPMPLDWGPHPWGWLPERIVADSKI